MCSIKRVPQVLFGLITFIKTCKIKNAAYGRVLAGVSFRMWSIAGIDPVSGHFGWFTSGLFHKREWCAQILRTSFRQRNQLSIT